MFVECLQARRIGVHYSEQRITPIITPLFPILHNTLKLLLPFCTNGINKSLHLDCFLLVVRNFRIYS
jgi:hypothetical protein